MCSDENLPDSLCQFFETQASFPLNFVLILGAIKHNSSILFWLKHYIIWSKAAHESVNF